MDFSSSLMAADNDGFPSSVKKNTTGFRRSAAARRSVTTPGMADWSDERFDAFKRVMARHGLTTAAAISRASGVSETTLRAYFQRRTKSLSSRNEAKIAKALGLTTDALYDEDYQPVSSPGGRVWVKGYVGAGNGVMLFEAMGEGEGFYEVSRPTVVKPGLKLGALEIRGGSMPPARDGDIIYYEEIDGIEPELILGEDCIVETEDGELLFKEVRRGYELGTFNLISKDGSPIRENVRLKRALPYVCTVRSRHARL